MRAAAGAEEALRALGDWPPDVIVSDIGLPGESGYDLVPEDQAPFAGRGGAHPGRR